MARSGASAIRAVGGRTVEAGALVLRLAGVVLRALSHLLAAIARSAPARAGAARVRAGARMATAWTGRRMARASEALYRRFGKPITVGLSGTAFVWMMVTPGSDPLYRGVDWANDADCLAMNIYHEARGEPEIGRLAVGHVVMNRVMDPRFPGTVCGVVMQGGEEPTRGCQFSWWCDGRDNRPADQRSWVESNEIAALIFAGASRDPTGGALWYHADYVKPAWRRTLVAGPKIGQHYFYLAPEKP